MSEQFGNLNINNEQVPLTTENTSLWLHYGPHEVYDHTFVHLPESFNSEEGEPRALYIFKSLARTALAYEAIKEGLSQFEEAEIHRNIRRPAKNDVERYFEASLDDLDGELGL